MVILRTLGYNAKVLKFGMGISPVKGIPIAGWTNYGFETDYNFVIVFSYGYAHIKSHDCSNKCKI